MGVICDLEPSGHLERGLHIHTYGDLDCGKTGDDWDVRKKGQHHRNVHGDPGDNSRKRHLGDLGNVALEQDGTAFVLKYSFDITLNGPNSIIGRSLVLHARPDDLGKGLSPFSFVNGNVGRAVACGVIGLTNHFNDVPFRCRK